MATNRKLLFISQGLGQGLFSGGAHGSQRNLAIVKKAFPGDVEAIALGRRAKKDRTIRLNPYPTLIHTVVFAFLGRIMSRPSTESTVADFVATGGYSEVFIDDSLHGHLARRLKLRFPNLTIYAYFHNIEVDYYRSLVALGGLQWLPFYMAARSNERLTCRCADTLIGLSRKDDARLHFLYGREFSVFLPVSFPQVELSPPVAASQLAVRRLLFVGAYFPNNVAGLLWFARIVFPLLEGWELMVVGQGMEKLRNTLSNTPGIVIKGRVEDLSSEYRAADAVVVPLFSGAGQKVKVAEALMYGKFIFGTKEAFAGYEFDPKMVGALCDTADDFVAAINKCPLGKHNSYSEEYFVANHTDEVMVVRLEKLFVNI